MTPHGSHIDDSRIIRLIVPASLALALLLLLPLATALLLLANIFIVLLLLLVCRLSGAFALGSGALASALAAT
jgi:hypothetical protein